MWNSDRCDLFTMNWDLLSQKMESRGWQKKGKRIKMYGAWFVSLSQAVLKRKCNACWVLEDNSSCPRHRSCASRYTGTEGRSRTALERICICFETNPIWVENAAECRHESEKGRLSTSVSDMHRTLLMWMSKTHWLCCEKLLEQGAGNSCKQCRSW